VCAIVVSNISSCLSEYIKEILRSQKNQNVDKVSICHIVIWSVQFIHDCDYTYVQIISMPFYNTNRTVLQPSMVQPYESYAADFCSCYMTKI